MTQTSSTADAPADQPAPHDEGAHAPPHYRMTQLVILSVTALCFALVWNAGRVLGIPAHPGVEASLVQQPGPVLAILAAVVLVAACGLIGQFLGGRHWVYAGPFAAAVALGALSIRGGPMRYVLFHADTHEQLARIPYLLALELVPLFTAVGGLWLVVTRRARALAAGGERVDVATRLTLDAAQGLLVQAGIMGFLATLLMPVDDKKQVLMALFVAAFTGTSVAEHFFKTARLGEWYWVGPLALGLIGYLSAGFTGAAPDLVTGHLTGAFAPLARPLPLDYASFGVAGALMGYWFGGEHPEAGFRVLTLRPEAGLGGVPGDRDGGRARGATPAATDVTAAGNGEVR